jgi:hypothetical protein
VDPFQVSVSLLAEYLLELFNKNFTVGSIRGYRSAISSTLKHFGRDIGSNKDISDLLTSMSVDLPREKRTMFFGIDFVCWKMVSCTWYVPLKLSWR